MSLGRELGWVDTYSDSEKTSFVRANKPKHTAQMVDPKETTIPAKRSTKQ
jgi:hypothetical protein